MLACVSVCGGVIGCNVATVAVACARKSSPCSACCGREREKVRPANEKWPKIGVLWRAGRTISRKCHWKPRAGRVISRKCHWKPRAGRTSSHLRPEKGLRLGSEYPGRCLSSETGYVPVGENHLFSWRAWRVGSLSGHAPPPPTGAMVWLCGPDGFAACSLVVAVNQQFRT